MMSNQTKDYPVMLPTSVQTPPQWAGPVLLTRSELQAVLRLSARTISRLVASGGIPAPIVVGQRYRWKTSDIVAFIEGAALVSDEAGKCVELPTGFTSGKEK